MFKRVRYQRLVPRGMPGLACDEEGLALGPIALIVRQPARKGWQYRPISRDLVEHAMTRAYGSAYARHSSWFYSWLGSVAENMSAAQHFSARTAAVQLGLPELSPRAFSSLNDLAQLLKLNPNWAQEPRDARGRWTSGGGDTRSPVIPVIGPFSPECVKAIRDAKDRCAQRYANLGGGLGFDWMRRCIRMLVPEDCGY